MIIQDGDYSWEGGERDEARLAELGRAAVHMFIMAHIFTERLEVLTPAVSLNISYWLLATGYSLF